jgi:hypothetical protein
VINEKRQSTDKRSTKILRGAASPTSARRLAAHQKQLRALDLRIGGATFQQIASVLGYADHAGARRAVLSALPKMREEVGKRLRQMELQRLRALWLCMFPLAQRGDTKAAGICIRVLKRRSEMLGLDAPRRLAIKGTVNAQVNGPAFKVYLVDRNEPNWFEQAFPRMPSAN